jgi:hypothetical protein
MNKRYFYIIFSAILSFRSFSQEKLLDRLLLKVEEKSYTQWEMEVYIFIKRTLYGKKPTDNPITSSKNWQKNIQEYIQDILWLAKIKAKGLLVEELDVIRKDQLENLFAQKKHKFPELAKRSKQLGINAVILNENLKRVNLLIQWSSLLRAKAKSKKNVYNNTLKKIIDIPKIVYYEKSFKKIRDL